MKTEIGEGLFLPKNYQFSQAGNRSNEDCIEEFLAWKKSYTQWAYRRYRIWVTRFQEFANCRPEEMRASDYVGFADWVKSNFSPKCAQYALNITHNYLRYYSEQGRLKFPMFLIRVPRARSESHYCLSETEYQAMLDGVVSLPGAIARRNEAIVRMLHDTGMRVGELVGLNVDDVNEERCARIPTEKTVEDRYVFWTPETQKALTRYRREWVQAFGGRDKLVGSSDAPLFVSSRGADVRITARSVERAIKQMSERAKLVANICPHSFRHAFIHRMARKGVPDSVTASLVGHTTPMTVAHYTKLSRTEQRHFVEIDSLTNR